MAKRKTAKPAAKKGATFCLPAELLERLRDAADALSPPERGRP
jgi:hypothetical protein